MSEALPSWGNYTVEELGPKLTCREADDFGDLLRVIGRDDLADELARSHNAADEAEDSHYQEGGLPG